MKKETLRTNLAVIAACLFLVGAVGCANYNSAQEEETRATMAASRQAADQIGMPAIKNFQERRLMKQIYELRDQADLVTYTYIIDMSGKRHFLTKSIGYGIPYAAQMTAPEYYVRHTGTTLPQPEPNGLYMPESAAATWIIALKDDGTQVPMYVEPEIVVSPFPLD